MKRTGSLFGRLDGRSGWGRSEAMPEAASAKTISERIVLAGHCTGWRALAALDRAASSPDPHMLFCRRARREPAQCDRLTPSSRSRNPHGAPGSSFRHVAQHDAVLHRRALAGAVRSRGLAGTDHRLRGRAALVRRAPAAESGGRCRQDIERGGRRTSSRHQRRDGSPGGRPAGGPARRADRHRRRSAGNLPGRLPAGDRASTTATPSATRPRRRRRWTTGTCRTSAGAWKTAATRSIRAMARSAPT